MVMVYTHLDPRGEAAGDDELEPGLLAVGEGVRTGDRLRIMSSGLNSLLGSTG